MWQKGEFCVQNFGEGFSVFRYRVKTYDEPSIYGINGGRIGKLIIRQDGKIVCRYNKVPDILPQTEEAEIALEVVLHGYN